MIQWMLAIWSLVPLPFLNPACTSSTSRFTYCWSLAWKIFFPFIFISWRLITLQYCSVLRLTLLACDMISGVWWFDHFCTALLCDWNEKLTFFSPVTTANFLKFADILSTALFLSLFFNWKIIALQNFVVFCQTPTRLSHKCTHVPSLPNLPLSSLPTPPF